MEELSLCDFLTSVRSLYLQLSFFKASFLLLIVPPSILCPAWGEGESKMYDRSALLDGHIQIMDYPISETSSGIVPLSDRDDGQTKGSGERKK